MADGRCEIADAVVAVRDGDRGEVEPECEDDRVGFLNVSEAPPSGFDVELQVSVNASAVSDDVTPVTAVDDPADATALVAALGRDGAFAELVDAVAAAYDLPMETAAEHLEADLHCTKAWSSESAVSNVVFQTRLGGDDDGLRSERLHADDLFY